MNILHIGKFYPPFHGGMENFLRDLAEAQVERGHRVTVLCHHHQRSVATSQEVHNGVTIIRAPNLGQVAYAPVSPGFTCKAAHFLRTESPDIVHVHLPNLSALFLTFIAKSPPIVIHWHSDVISAPGLSLLRILYPPYRVLEKRLLKRASKIVVTSRDYLDTSTPLAPYRTKCATVPLGLDQKRMEPLQKDFRGAEGTELFWALVSKAACLVVAVGRFTIYKGFDFLIQAAARIPQVTVVIVGDGPLREQMISLRKKQGCEQNVLLPGMLSDRELHQLLARCDMCVLPSIERTEAFGLVLLEAMYYAKPLVTTRVPGSGMNMVNIHEQTGLVVPPGDVQALAHAIERLSTNPSLRKELGTNGRQRFEKEFSATSVANQVDMVYSEC